MPYIKVYIHFVWSTKKRFPFFTSQELREQVWMHIHDYASSKGIVIDQINGYAEHCHCLVSLRGEQTLGEIMKLIKGESSHWINKGNLTEEKFAWQDEYFAMAVSPSMVEKVRAYIRSQESHHQIKPFQQEYDDLIQKIGVQTLKND
ncbi:MAG: IS200/IS605 family transposase [Paludibacter sp.]|jgi:REP element-mobilizing transposase RayT|nr:IS200/IS605 family transposase [Paludibacter sp.]